MNYIPESSEADHFVELAAFRCSTLCWIRGFEEHRGRWQEIRLELDCGAERREK